MTKTQTPRRVYAVRHIATGTTRLVRAVNVATAMRHVVRTDYSAEVASQDDLIDLLSAGTRVEDAGADDLGEPPVKVLRFTAAVAEPPPERDPRVPDMFDDAPAADHVGDAAEMVDPLAAGGFAPCGRALGDCGKATQACGRDGCGAEVVEMPPQHAPIAAVPEDLASGEPAEPAAPDASAPAGVALGSSESGVDGAPAADAPTQAERMASAYAAGVEIARQGHTRWSAEFLDANAAVLSGLRDAAADEVHAEMLRGFEDGQPIPKRRPELKQQAEEAAARAGGKIVAKYRDPATGQTWTGRGMKPRWLVQALEDGRTQDEFLIENQGEQA